MPKITLERTLETSYRDLGGYHTPIEDAAAAFKDYNRRIKLLGVSGRLQIEDLVELIPEDEGARYNVTEKVRSVADKALAEKNEKGDELYWPGSSTVIVTGSGRVIAAYDNPNDIPYLNAAGPGLMWALLKVGQERYAAGRTKGVSGGGWMPGYQAVSDALTMKPMAHIPYGQRHHIGGASTKRSLYPGSDSMRVLETEDLHAGVSGVVATGALRQRALDIGFELRTIIDQAEKYDVLDGFAGNLLAGSLDSTLGSLMLVAACDDVPRDPRTFTEFALDAAIHRHKDGINVH